MKSVCELERQHLLIQRAYRDGLKFLEETEQAAVFRAPGFDYVYYLTSPGGERDRWERALKMLDGAGKWLRQAETLLASGKEA